MLQTKKLTGTEQIGQIYRIRMKKDFAPDELKPLSAIIRAWEKGNYDCFVLTEGKELLGYAFFARKDSRYLFDFLAVSEEHRGEGFGTVFLKQLSECLPEADCIVGEVEDPEMAKDENDRLLRERRLQFYLRNGYRLTGVRARTFGVDYRILEAQTGRERTSEEISAIYTELYRTVMPDSFFRKHVMITGKNG